MTQAEGKQDPAESQPAAEPHRRRADSGERAYHLIRRLVVDFQLRPNEHINEVQLARDCALSRTPIREALNRLATEGFLSFVPNRGFFFRSPDIEELVQIYEARAVVEQGAFALACDRATAAGLLDMQQFWASARAEYDQRDADRILELDETFHVKLAELSGNQELVRQLVSINARIRFVRRLEIERGPRQAEMVSAHDGIVKALGQRATVQGKRLLTAHISMSIGDAGDALKEAVFKAFTSKPTAA